MTTGTVFIIYRLVKLSLPNFGDFELIFTQIQQFINICSKEQIQFSVEKCKYLTLTYKAYYDDPGETYLNSMAHSELRLVSKGTLYL